MSNLHIWPPPKRRTALSVVIPCSVLTVEQSLYEKTMLLGSLARALAIFRVDEALIFVDDECRESDLEIMSDVIEYLLTPPYLRRKVIGRKETLRYAGALPPLNIPTHPASGEGFEVLPFREGVILKVRGRKAKVDVGLGESVIAEIPDGLLNEVNLRVGGRVYVKIITEVPLRGVLVSESDIPYYLGFRSSMAHSAGMIIERLKAPGVLGVLTTKYGGDASRLLSELKDDVKEITIMFGNHRKDFNELLDEAASRDLSDVVKIRINTIPLQGVRSVRTLEALYATLALINSFIP